MHFSKMLRLLRSFLPVVLFLAPGCNWEQDNPLVCGDGKKAMEEACDGADVGQSSCKGLGYYGGILSCTSACKLDISKCKNCGNGVKNMGEVCDGSALGGKTCKDMGYEGGTMGCKSDCSWYDTSTCYKCGDGKKAASEKCDGASLDSKTCADLGYEGGALKCRKDCVFDTSGCYKCGDNKVTGSDTCDGTALASKTCKDFNFQGGALKCKSDCSWFDTNGCYKCGDGKITGSDVCDGSALGGMTCKTMGWEGGTLSCKSDCTRLVMTGCYRCGDKKKNGNEKCDATDLGGATCASLGYVEGTADCKPDCTLDSSKCKPNKWIWAKRGGGSNIVRAYDITVDSSGQSYVVGSYWTSATFGKTTLTATSHYSTGWVTKLDAGGNFLWAMAGGGKYPVRAQELMVDDKGNSYILSQFDSVVTFGGIATLGFLKDGLLAKVDSNGKTQWAIKMGGPGTDTIIDIASDGKKHIYVSGWCQDWATFGNTPPLSVSPYNVDDMCVAKLQVAP